MGGPTEGNGQMAADPFGSRLDDEAQGLVVEAIGEPGQRRFRFMAIVDGDTHIVWMEKQQLQALGMALDQLLDQLPDRGPELGGSFPPMTFDTQTLHQFRVGRMELGYDDRRNRLVIVAHDIETDGDDEIVPPFSCRITRAQARDLSVNAAVVVSAGRPRCTMCGSPMGPGNHVCPHQNGHLPISFTDLDLDDEDDDDDDDDV